MKKSIVIICIFLMMILPIWIFKNFFLNKIHKLYIKEYIVTQNLFCDVSIANIEDSLLYIEGFLVYPGIAEPVANENKYLYFFNNNSDDVFVTRIGDVYIGDKATNIINDGKDYSCAGFCISIDLKKIDIYQNSYSLYCGYQSNGNNFIVDMQYDIDYGKIIKE